MKPVQEKGMMKIPAEAVELYTRYIHGEVSRRDFLRGVKRFASPLPALVRRQLSRR